MEIIKAYKNVVTKEAIELNVEDTKNCYLKGNDAFNNTFNYLGIWTDKQGLKVVEITNQNIVKFDICKNESIYTSVDIEKFMEHNNNVQVISKELFRKELDRILDLLRENSDEK